MKIYSLFRHSLFLYKSVFAMLVNLKHLRKHISMLSQTGAVRQETDIEKGSLKKYWTKLNRFKNQIAG